MKKNNLFTIRTRKKKLYYARDKKNSELIVKFNYYHSFAYTVGDKVRATWWLSYYYNLLKIKILTSNFLFF